MVSIVQVHRRKGIAQIVVIGKRSLAALRETIASQEIETTMNLAGEIPSLTEEKMLVPMNGDAIKIESFLALIVNIHALGLQEKI